MRSGSGDRGDPWPDIHEPEYAERLRSLTQAELEEELAELERIRDDLREGDYSDKAIGNELDAVHRAICAIRNELQNASRASRMSTESAGD